MQKTTQQQTIHIDPNDAESISCDECENEYFVSVFMIKHVSKFVSPSGEEAFIPMQLFQCAKCGHVNKNFIS